MGKVKSSGTKIWGALQGTQRTFRMYMLVHQPKPWLFGRLARRPKSLCLLVFLKPLAGVAPPEPPQRPAPPETANAAPAPAPQPAASEPDTTMQDIGNIFDL